MAKNSSWRMGAAARRDERHTLSSDAAPTRNNPNKRDTKKWCRGKVGVEHKLAVKTYAELKGWETGGGRIGNWLGWLIQYCSVCGKQTAMYSPPWGDIRLYRKPPAPPPDWALAYFDEHPEERPVYLTG